VGIGVGVNSRDGTGVSVSIGISVNSGVGWTVAVGVGEDMLEEQPLTHTEISKIAVIKALLLGFILHLVKSICVDHQNDFTASLDEALLGICAFALRAPSKST